MGMGIGLSLQFTLEVSCWLGNRALQVRGLRRQLIIRAASAMAYCYCLLMPANGFHWLLMLCRRWLRSVRRLWDEITYAWYPRFAANDSIPEARVAKSYEVLTVCTGTATVGRVPFCFAQYFRTGGAPQVSNYSIG